MLIREYEEDQTSLKNSIQDLRESMPAPLSASFEKPFLSLTGLVASTQYTWCQNRLERCFGSCLQHKMAAQLGHVYQDNPSTNEQAADRQCIEISYTKNTEK